ncbi:MAG: DUF1045 domain-containing protein [Desulfovibrionaceae bacterium]|nr:DUF1045 domain-containing protein [Desulfovibrionaceae bacterium]
MGARYAIYYIPEPGTALAALGSALLGRDSETGETIPQASLTGFSRQSLSALTADARRYGLHATLKAPFFLKKGMTERDLLLAAARFVMGRQTITLPQLELARIGSFFTLVPHGESQEGLKAIESANTLAADTVAFFEPFRAAPSEQEFARREPQKLTDRQRALLAEWGYPYVFDEYRFHITLTDRLRDRAEASRMEKGLRSCFASACDEKTLISGICVCKQITPDSAQRTARLPGNDGSAFIPIMRLAFQSSQK